MHCAEPSKVQHSYVQLQPALRDKHTMLRAAQHSERACVRPLVAVFKKLAVL